MTDSGSRDLKSISRASIFGAAPILPEEDPAAYDALLERVVASVKLKDVIDEILVRDVVDNTWEILRWRRLKTELIKQATAAALRAKLSSTPKRGSSLPDMSELLGDLVPATTSVKKLVAKWARKNPTATKRVNKLLMAAGTTIDAVTADATIAKLDVIERIDHLATIAEARRNVALREIDRHRFALAQAIREKINEIEDAEFKTIEPATPQIKSDAA